ncbi:sugar ABC transporter substrate-binding protein [Plantibacter sp. MCCC 1A11337]|uniref:ABC transporter substrate-binding protein n=1 Tax=Plantibacter sp. MCCC 1A11337 TaxID=2736644 RepID=UPI001C2E9C0E|nr:sugar ABC transporter substrate-binding protein [Plantibacter sp. MCCC 1A11337]
MDIITGGPVISRATLLRGMGAAALLSVTGVSLAACAPGAGPNGPTSGKLVFVVYGDAEAQKTYNRLFAAFSKQYPGIQLQALAIAADTWADFLNTVSTRIAGGQQIDVIQVATEGQRLFASRDVLEPLDSFISKDRSLVDEYYADTPPQLREWLNTYGSPDGRTYYMPTGYNTMALQVSTKVLSQAGIELPDAGWTWDEFRAAGQTLKSKTGAFIGTAGSGYFIDVMPWLVNNGASTMDADWTKPTFYTPQAVEALEFVRSLVVDQLVPKPGGTFDAASQMQKGKLATFGGGRWPTAAFQDLKMSDQVTLRPWPRNQTEGTVVGWEGWPILKGSKNKEAAWTLIKFLMSKEYGEAITTGGASFVPARVSITTGPLFTKDAPSNSTLLYEQLPTAVPLPAPDRSTEFARIVEEAWSQGVTGAKSADTALRDAQKKLEGLVS